MKMKEFISILLSVSMLIVHSNSFGMKCSCYKNCKKKIKKCLKIKSNTTEQTPREANANGEIESPIENKEHNSTECNKYIKAIEACFFCSCGICGCAAIILLIGSEVYLEFFNR